MVSYIEKHAHELAEVLGRVLLDLVGQITALVILPTENMQIFRHSIKKIK